MPYKHNISDEFPVFCACRESCSENAITNANNQSSFIIEEHLDELCRFRENAGRIRD